MYVCMYVYDIKCVYFSKYKIIKWKKWKKSTIIMLY
jgi:hypothetical protein